MKVLLHNWQREFATTIMHMIVGAIFLFTLGYYAPRIYIQYFDQTQHIHFNEPGVSFDKKVYNKCGDMITAKVDFFTDQDYQLTEDIRVNKLLPDGSVQVMKQYLGIKTFANESPSKVYVIPFNLCSIPQVDTGIYFFEGQYHYNYKGIAKIYAFSTELISIQATPGIK